MSTIYKELVNELESMEGATVSAGDLVRFSRLSRKVAAASITGHLRCADMAHIVSMIADIAHSMAVGGLNND